MENKTKISIKPHGPAVVTGGVTLEMEDGTIKEVAEEEVCAVCRCGKSQNQPFCDGSHLKE